VPIRWISQHQWQTRRLRRKRRPPPSSMPEPGEVCVHDFNVTSVQRAVDLTNCYRIASSANTSCNLNHRPTYAPTSIPPTSVPTCPAFQHLSQPLGLQGRQCRYQCCLVNIVSYTGASAEAAFREKMGSQRDH